MRKINVEQKVIKIDPFTEMKIYPGLCSCCSLAPTCTYPRVSGRSILQCDEFDGITRPPEQVVKMKEKPPANRFSETVSDVQGRSNSTGLCAYCDGLKNCTYPKPEGGVWHCEEYR